MNWYLWDEDTLILNLHLQPKASKDEWVGLHGDRLKLKITAPPVDGKANQYLLSFLAQEFGVSKTACQLIAGESGRQKRIAIMMPKCFPKLLEELNLKKE